MHEFEWYNRAILDEAMERLEKELVIPERVRPSAVDIAIAVEKGAFGPKPEIIEMISTLTYSPRDRRRTRAAISNHD